MDEIGEMLYVGSPRYEVISRVKHLYQIGGPKKEYADIWDSTNCYFLFSLKDSTHSWSDIEHYSRILNYEYELYNTQLYYYLTST